MTLNNSINDYNKNNLIKDTKYNFYRIRYDTNKFIFDENDDLFIKIKQFEYNPSYSITYKQKIITKEYFIQQSKSILEKILTEIILRWFYNRTEVLHYSTYDFEIGF
jgi:hypothetical protein